MGMRSIVDLQVVLCQSGAPTAACGSGTSFLYENNDMPERETREQFPSRRTEVLPVRMDRFVDYDPLDIPLERLPIQT
jgi:hypothetical protein